MASQLKIPEPMVLDLFAQCNKPKTSKTIQCFEQWVICSNTYTVVMTTWLPNRMNDLLGYASLTVKASKTMMVALVSIRCAL